MSERAIDPMAVLMALGVSDACGAAPGSGGSDSAIWRVERPGGAHALRLSGGGGGEPRLGREADRGGGTTAWSGAGPRARSGSWGRAPGAALLHLDYHLLNVMTDRSRVTGVLDWTNARAGDPRADLARTFT